MNNELLAKEFFIVGKLLTYPSIELKKELENIVDIDHPVSNTLKQIDDKSFENLQGEYTRLFITGYPKTPCPPYYSAYKTGLVVSDHTDYLYNLYAEYGIEIPEGQFPDFIPVLMEFMVLLLSNDKIEDAKSFHSKYITWLLVFAENIKDNTSIEYFNLISKNISSLLKDSNDYFNSLT